MCIPKYNELYNIILKSLSDRKEITLKELREKISISLKLSNEELKELLPSGKKSIFSSRLDWSTTYLKNAKLIDKPSRGKIVITLRGYNCLGQNIDNNFLLKFIEFQEYLQKSEKVTKTAINIQEDNNIETPDETLEQAFQKINNTLKNELLDYILKLTSFGFEKLVIDLLSKMGYGSFENAGKTTSKSNDEGIDGIIMEDKLGFNLIYIQAKKWDKNTSVGRPEIQKFVGAINKKQGKGLFVTTSNFSKQAIEYSNENHIILINGDKLVKLMIEYNFGVKIKKSFEIKEIDFDIFEDY